MLQKPLILLVAIMILISLFMLYFLLVGIAYCVDAREDSFLGFLKKLSTGFIIVDCAFYGLIVVWPTIIIFAVNTVWLSILLCLPSLITIYAYIVIVLKENFSAVDDFVYPIQDKIDRFLRKINIY